MGTLEKEVNYLIHNYEGLLMFLDATCEGIGKYRISFDYYEHSRDGDLYARTEMHDTGEVILTMKKKLHTERGITVREEASLCLESLIGAKELLHIVGLSYAHSKSKKRVSYVYGDLKIDVDTWYALGFEEEIESRIEIEGDNEDDILSFAKRVGKYVIDAA